MRPDVQAAGMCCVAVASTLSREHLEEADLVLEKIENLLDVEFLRCNR